MKNIAVALLFYRIKMFEEIFNGQSETVHKYFNYGFNISIHIFPHDYDSSYFISSLCFKLQFIKKSIIFKTGCLKKGM